MFALAKFGSLQGSTSASLQKFGEFLKLRFVIISHSLFDRFITYANKIGSSAIRALRQTHDQEGFPSKDLQKQKYFECQVVIFQGVHSTMVETSK